MATKQTDRYRQIAEVLVGSGWGALAQATGLSERVSEYQQLVGRLRGSDAPARASHTIPGPIRLREAFEKLGPTFVKLGQMLAGREDLLPPEYVRELQKLQDNNQPVQFEAVADVIGRELGDDPLSLFASIEPAPLAVGSLGQTHRAVLRDGTDVVVKVLRPGVADTVRADLAILRELATVATKQWSLAADHDLSAMVAGFDASLRRELDLTVEASNAKRFAADLADDPVVRIPRVFGDLCSTEVLTEEAVSGMRITDSAALDAAGIDRPALAEAATRTIVSMVVRKGFFHADPHPGNMFVRADGLLWLIDFGKAGELDERTRTEIVLLVFALGRKDTDSVTRRLLKLAPPRGLVDRARLRKDVDSLIAAVSGTLTNISMAHVATEVTGLVRRHRLQLPPNITELLRMLVLVESSAVTLDPGFNVSTVINEVGRATLEDDWAPRALLDHVKDEGEQWARVAADMPDRILALVDDYEQNGIRAKLDARDLDPLVERLEATGDRVIVGVTLGALLVGMSTVLANSPRADKLREPLLIAAGGAAGLMGTYLSAGAGPVRGAKRFVRRMVKS